jgi:hypothetical protein
VIDDKAFRRARSRVVGSSIGMIVAIWPSSLRHKAAGFFVARGYILSAQWTGNNAPFKFARASVRASMPNDEHQKVAALGAFERPHLVPSGNRRDPYDDPFDIASNAVELGIHGARFLQLYFGANCLTRGLI